MIPPRPSNELPKAGQRIAKLLARAGIASRREVERMIEERRVAIDGVAIETPATILASLAGVTVDGVPVKAAAPARLFLYHKPAGLLTAERDPQGRPTIYDRMPPDLPRLMPVGRLDLNTEGLLLLTTDGELKRQLELPSSGVERVYRARTFGDVTQEQLEALIEGVEIEGIRYGAIDANLERRTGRNQWIEVRITEGKNREVRRVLEYLGLQVSRLIRIAYGPFVLEDLPAGQVHEIRQHDLVQFRKDMSGAKPEALRSERPRSRPATPPAAQRRPATPTARPARQASSPRAAGPRTATFAGPDRPSRDRSTAVERTGRGKTPPVGKAAGERGASPRGATAAGRRERPERNASGRAETRLYSAREVRDERRQSEARASRGRGSGPSGEARGDRSERGHRPARSDSGPQRAAEVRGGRRARGDARSSEERASGPARQARDERDARPDRGSHPARPGGKPGRGPATGQGGHGRPDGPKRPRPPRGR